LITVAQPVVSPDGRRVAFTVLRADPQGNGYRSQVWVAQGGGAPPTAFSSGEHRDGNPCWSPDGARLAIASAFVTRTRDARYDEDDEGERDPERVRPLYRRL